MTTPNTDALPTDEEIRLHLGELSTRELRIAKAAIQWANIRTPAPSVTVEELEAVFVSGFDIDTKAPRPQRMTSGCQAILTQFNVSKKEG